VQLDPAIALSILVGNQPKTKEGYGIDIEAVTATSLEVANFTNDFADRVLTTLTQLPNGVKDWRANFKNLVGTSSNLGVISQKTNEGGIEQLEVIVSMRGFEAPDVSAMNSNYSQLFNEAGFAVSSGKYAPAWFGDRNSVPVAATAEAYETVTGKKAEIKGVHAGLETGEICKKIEAVLGRKVEAVSFGPTIKGAHSTKERVDIASVEVFYAQTKVLLSKLIA
jgi:dipeptidase D